MTTTPPVFDLQHLEVAAGVRRLALADSGPLTLIVRDDQTDLYDRDAGRVVRSLPGIGLGAPDGDDVVVFLEHPTPTQFQVRSSADDRVRATFELGPEHWNVEAAAVTPERIVIALRSGNQQAFVALGGGPPIVVQRPADANLTAPGAVAAADATRLFVTTVTATAVVVEALDGADLRALWSTTLTPPPAREPDPPSGRPADDPPPPGRALPWGYEPAAMIAASGDATHLLVIVGPPVGRGLGDPQWLVSIDARTGRAGPTRRSTELGLLQGGVAAAAGVPGGAGVALLHVTTRREGMSDNLTRRLDGISRLDLAAGTRAEVAPAAAPAPTAPAAIAISAAGEIVLAP
ncbi:MAG: hypothetical protein IPL61_32950 [Myxococcales bacterium]|nr:hypothetical protein [Myxococcales bacterium]